MLALALLMAQAQAATLTGSVTSAGEPMAGAMVMVH